MLPILAFSSNGFLIGLIIALSEDQLSRILIPFLFAAFGGSIFAFAKKMTDAHRREAYVSLFSLSTSCLMGVIVGILAVQHQWLGDSFIRSTSVAGDHPKQLSSKEVQRPLRSLTIEQFDAIDVQVRQGQLSKEAAYDELIQFINKAEAKK